MTAKRHPTSSSPSHKASALRLSPAIKKQLRTNCKDVSIKLKRARRDAKSGATTGAMIIALNRKGEWSLDLAGQLMHDDDTLFLIASRVFGTCLVAQ